MIKDNELTFRAKVGGKVERKKSFKLDPGKTPKEIDISSLDGSTAACIYKLEKDRLTICMSYFTKGPSKRPTEFKTGAEDGLMVLTLEKVKAK